MLFIYLNVCSIIKMFVCVHNKKITILHVFYIRL